MISLGLSLIREILRASLFLSETWHNPALGGRPQLVPGLEDSLLVLMGATASELAPTSGAQLEGGSQSWIECTHPGNRRVPTPAGRRQRNRNGKAGVELHHYYLCPSNLGKKSTASLLIKAGRNGSLCFDANKAS
ncbi:hypothetical protein CCM_03976 [Cordyceps militaris CM01]|uniref:Uncharacterized protein n=1 Tax=Cordyceps militaris (strain CM01) TaxID=983644 RepID=G3JDC8_CORMM|nr:uncharacterized protein CCM_03976 [Cordyceps militaris CM01]EGX92603.1 hypothetical protein CCM_03976 [Cordyceps militaris CM01]